MQRRRDDGPLFEQRPEALEPTARRGDPATSYQAAAAIAGRAGSIRAKIMQALEAAGRDGLTAEECAAATGKLLQSVTPRMRELDARGLAKKNGHTRTGTAGVQREVWVASAYAERRAS